MVTSETVTKHVHGVKAVANDIEVRPADDEIHDDGDLAMAALHALEWDVHVPKQRVTVTVRNGCVTLEGDVDWQYQKEAASRAVRHLRGVRSVINALKLRPTEQQEDIKASIEAAFLRSASVDSKRIGVETQNGTVILRGDLHSHPEREEAERIAWSAPGVNRVDNYITITPWGSGSADEWGY